MSRAPSPAAQDADPRRWRALGVTLVVGFMALLDVTIVTVALPSIARGLDASAADLQWIVSGYALTFGLVLVAGGRLGDIIGRRTMFLLGLAGFTLTSAVAGAAPTAELLVAARLLQGVAAGMLTPQNTGLIQELFQGPERGRAFGIFGTTMGVSAATGPILGGLIIGLFGPDLGWRFVFLVNVPIGLVAMVLAARLIPRSTGHSGALREQVDGVGAALLGLAVLCVLLPLVESMGSPTTPIWLMAPFVVLLTWLFVRWERRIIRLGRAPVLDIRLFRNAGGFATGIALGTLYFCGFSGLWLVLALFFQDGLGYSALQSGLAVTPFAIGGAVTAVIAGRVVDRFDRVLTVTGLALNAVGFGAMAVVIPMTMDGATAGYVALPLLIAGIGSGMVISPNITLTLRHVPPRMGGAAGGALQTGQRVGTAVGAAVLAAAFRITLGRTSDDYSLAIVVALLCAIGFVLMALVLAFVELRARRTGRMAGAETTPAHTKA